MSESHSKYMQRCIELAQMGLGKVSPNPLVGCVIVHKGKIIGEGYHKKYGGPHAEVEAIQSVSDKSLLKKSILYVNLEPCSHYGKTPPCVDLIAKHQIPKVVIGTKDPFVEVNGAGLDKLLKAKVDVTIGVLENECHYLNRRFFTFHNKKRPYIILKWAQTNNGFMAGGPQDPKYISGKDALKLVHKWRTEEDAFMVGTNTVLVDNPLLTNRHWEGRNPTRITIDREMAFDPALHILNEEAPTLVFNALKDDQKDNVEWIKADMEFNFSTSYTKALYERNIQSVVVEGGKILLNYFIDKGLWDEARVFISNETRFQMGLKSPQIEISALLEENLSQDKLYYFFK